jgi:lantibiotic modifying enzyme
VPEMNRLVAPVTNYCWRELSNSSQHINLLSRSARATWKRVLCARLARGSREIIKWEKDRDRQNTDSRPLVRPMTDHLKTVELLYRYPALARLWTAQIENWITFVSEFLIHTKDFLRARGLAHSRHEHAVEQFMPELSDPHGGNRSVLQVRLRDGSLWFYKPRSGLDEQAWNSFLRLVNQNGFSKSFRVAKVIPCDRHFWMEAVVHRASRSEREVSAFFYRGGALLYLAHYLRAVDLHAGNLFAHGEHPVLVDCETFLHPPTRVPRLARWSVSPLVRTGLLPAEVDPTDGREDVTVFGRREAGPHRQELGGRARFAGEYIEDFLNGFKHMHSIVGKTGLVRRATELFPQRARVIYRPTQYYQAVYENSLAPGTLMNGFDRSLFLHAACPSGPTPGRCLQSEINALADGDVPLFHERRGSPRSPPSPASMRVLTARIRALLCR